MATARTLSQILAELSPAYDPQVANLRQRQSLLPQQMKTEETALGAKKDEAFESIIGGARRRGIGFSGIPLGEQAKYSATEYLPALARLRQSGQEQALSLEDAILGITERRNTLAQQLLQQERDRAEQIRQFNENLRFQREEGARSRQAASASAFSPSLGLGGASAPTTRSSGSDANASARQEVVNVIGNRDYAQLARYITAITKSAGYGNKVDKLKLEYLKALQPGLFPKGKLDTGRLSRLQNMQSGGAVI